MGQTIEQVLIEMKTDSSQASKEVGKVNKAISDTGKKSKFFSNLFDRAVGSVKSFAVKFSQKFSDIISVIKEFKKKHSEATETIKKSSKETKSGIVSLLSKYVGLSLIISKIFNETRLVNNEMAKQKQVLKSTGYAAGLTAKDLKSMADDMQAATTFDKGDILRAQNILLTFTNVTKSEFKDVLSIGMDMSAFLGDDLKTNMIRVGKAFQMGSAGMAQLREIGVNFTADQIKQAQAWEKTGQKMKVTQMILKELRTEFGGAAEAIGSTPFGKIEKFFNTLKNIFVSIGDFILPFITTLIDGVSSIISLFGELPGVVKIAALALVAFLSGPIGMIAALTAGFLALFNSMQPTVRTTEDLAKAVDSAKSELSAMGKELSKVEKNKGLLKQLKGLKQGTDEYKRVAQQIINTNPVLRDSNYSVAMSYNEIERAVLGVNGKLVAQQKLKALDVRDKMLQNIKDSILMIAKLQYAYDHATRGTEEFTRAKIRLEAAIEKTKSAFAVLGQSSRLAGLGLVGAFTEIKGKMQDISSMFGTKLLRSLTQLGRNGETVIKRDITQPAIKAFQEAFGTGGALTKVAPIATSGQSLSQIKKDFIDIAQIRRDVMLESAEGTARERLQIEYDLAKEIDEINKKAEKKKGDRAEAIALLKKKAEIKIQHIEEKWRKEQNEKDKQDAQKKTQQQFEIVESTQGYWTDFQNLLKGDYAGFMNRLAKDTNQPWIAWAAFGMQVIQDVFGLFKSRVKEEMEAFQDQLGLISDFFSDTGTINDMWDEILGAGSVEAIEKAIASSEEAISRVFNQFGVNLSKERIASLIESWTYGRQQFLSWISSEGDQGWWSDMWNDVFSEVDWNNKLKELFGDQWQLVNQLLGGYEKMEDLIDEIDGNLGEFSSYADAIFDSFSNVFDAMQDIEDLNIDLPIAKYREELAALEHEFNIGKIAETELFEQQIELYDLMIDALADIADSQELINQLEEDRYAIQQKLNSALNEEATIQDYLTDTVKGKELQALLDAKEKLELAITEGRIAEGSQTATYLQQEILEAIKENLSAQNADTSILQDYAEQLAAVQTAALGEYGFATRSGTGEAVSIDFPELLGTGSSTSTSTVTNTTNNFGDFLLNNVLKGSSQDLMSIFQQFLATTGVNLYQGAY